MGWSVIAWPRMCSQTLNGVLIRTRGHAASRELESTSCSPRCPSSKPSRLTTGHRAGTMAPCHPETIATRIGLSKCGLIPPAAIAMSISRRDLIRDQKASPAPLTATLLSGFSDGHFDWRRDQPQARSGASLHPITHMEVFADVAPIRFAPIDSGLLQEMRFASRSPWSACLLDVNNGAAFRGIEPDR
jgi:hypothetical protein